MGRILCAYELLGKDKEVLGKHNIDLKEGTGKVVTIAIMSLDRKSYLSAINPDNYLSSKARKSLARQFIRDLCSPKDLRLDLRVWVKDIETILSQTPSRVSTFLDTYRYHRQEGVEYYLFEALKRGIPFEKIGEAFEAAADMHYRNAEKKAGETGVALQFHWNMPQEYRLIQRHFYKMLESA